MNGIEKVTVAVIKRTVGRSRVAKAPFTIQLRTDQTVGAVIRAAAAVTVMVVAAKDGGWGPDPRRTRSGNRCRRRWRCDSRRRRRRDAGPVVAGRSDEARRAWRSRMRYGFRKAGKWTRCGHRGGARPRFSIHQPIPGWISCHRAGPADEPTSRPSRRRCTCSTGVALRYRFGPSAPATSPFVPFGISQRTPTRGCASRIDPAAIAAELPLGLI